MVTMPAVAVEAERAVLATILASPPALATARLTLDGGEFYTPDHGFLYGLICDLDDARIVPDPAAVVSELRRRGKLTQPVWRNGVTVTDLAGSCVTATNIRYHLALLRDAARVRAVQEAHARLGQMLEQYQANGDTDVLLDHAAQQSVALGLVADNPGVDAPVPGVQTWEEFTAVSGAPRWIVPGLIRRHDTIMILGSSGAGKALAIDTPILTANRGWQTMGSLTTSDLVFGPDGVPVRIVAATDVLTDRPCYRVDFSDGAQIVADGNHQWQTQTPGQRAAGTYGIHTTEEIAGSVRTRGDDRLGHSIDVCEALQYPTVELPFPPYTLGAWLGDGTSRQANITSIDVEVVEAIRADGFDVTPDEHSTMYWRIRSDTDRAARIDAALDLVAQGAGVRQAERHAMIGRGALAPLVDSSAREWSTRPRVLTAAQEWVNVWRAPQSTLREMGVLNNKHIPEEYQRASIPQRVALLQGLMDTDGTIDTKGRAEFCVCNERLARDVHRLIVGLGHKAALRESDAVLDGRVVGRRWRIGFLPRFPVCRLSRKAERQRPIQRPHSMRRYIVGAERVESVPVRCIQVARADGLFLAGRTLITTHNSVLSRQVAMCLAAGVHPFTLHRIEPVRTLLVDLENAPDQVAEESTDMIAGVRRLGDPSGRGFIWPQPEGLNLRKRADAALLERVIAQTSPDVLCMGSLYNAYRRGRDDWDTAAEDVQAVLKRLRGRYGLGLWLEHHMPRKEGSGHTGTPYGGTLWERWPTHGRWLRRVSERGAVFALEQTFRGDRGVRDLPAGFTRGGKLPWSAVMDPEELGLIRDAFEGGSR